MGNQIGIDGVDVVSLSRKEMAAALGSGTRIRGAVLGIEAESTNVEGDTSIIPKIKQS